jgi:serine/threonine protein kinase
VDTEQPRLEGRRLTDRYVLEEQLASGGMGALWLARDEVLGRPVAVKVLHDHLARDEGLLERFRLEAVAAARLSHPAVVRVFDTGVSEGVCFIVMELVEGQTVRELLTEKGALPPAEAGRILRGILQALAHAHREGVVHRDVKPGNILMARDGLVKLADFGIAKAAFAQGDVTTTGDLLGTSRYLAPEQVTGGDVDQRSDLYSAGVVLYELLTGRPPFDGGTHIATATMRLTKDPSPPRSMRPGISRPLEAVVMRALAREPDERFQTAEEMSSALEHAVPVSGRPREERTEVHEPVIPHRRRSLLGSWVAIPIILAVIAGLIVGGFLLLEGFSPNDEPAPSDAAASSTPLEIANVYAYDPPPGDAEEHDDTLTSAVDGSATTFWTTESYSSVDLGGAKDGVGLVLELADEVEVETIAIETDLPGWEFSAYTGESPTGFDVSASAAGGPFTVEDGGTYQIEPTETRYVLIWITELVESGGSLPYGVHVNEIELFPPGA